MPESNPWRSAFIGSIIAIALSPLSLVLGYYLSKYLAAPKLSIEYIVTVVDTTPLKVNKTLIPELQDVLQTLQSPGPYMVGYDPLFQQCYQQFQRGSLDLDCVKRFQTNLKVYAMVIDYEESLFKQDRDTLTKWDGKPADLKLIPVNASPTQSLEEMATHDRSSTISTLNDEVRDYDNDRQILEILTKQLDDFVAGGITRSGSVTFKIGVLNRGDSDGVIFPKSDLSSVVSTLKLRTATNSPVPFMYVPPFNSVSTSSYTVVKAHSFTEITIEIDEATSPPDMATWKQLVIARNPEEFQITLPTSAKSISRTDHLPTLP